MELSSRFAGSILVSVPVSFLDAVLVFFEEQFKSVISAKRSFLVRTLLRKCAVFIAARSPLITEVLSHEMRATHTLGQQKFSEELVLVEHRRIRDKWACALSTHNYDVNYRMEALQGWK